MILARFERENVGKGEKSCCGKFSLDKGIILHVSKALCDPDQRDRGQTRFFNPEIFMFCHTLRSICNYHFVIHPELLGSF